jgi:hypothetical protein
MHKPRYDLLTALADLLEYGVLDYEFCMYRFSEVRIDGTRAYDLCCWAALLSRIEQWQQEHPELAKQPD